MYLKGRFVKYSILINIGVGKYAALCKCMYIFIIGNQLTTQNIDKYCPETLTGSGDSWVPIEPIFIHITRGQRSRNTL